MNKDKRKFGFTLAEVMVCMALIAVMVTLLMPAVSKARPNKNKMLFKKAYMLTERIVNELINDEKAYAVKSGTVGFDNTDTSSYDEDATGNKKFCILFASKLNTININPVCGNSGDISFTTNDGIEWKMPIGDFKQTGAETTADETITIDVSGSAKGSNCTSREASNENSTCKTPDIFNIEIQPNGKIYIDQNDSIAKGYLKSISPLESVK